MKEALKRLQHLQSRLEELHRETATVLAESHRLMEDVERESTSVRGSLDPAPQQRPKAKSAKGARRSR